ncbi:MAG: DNA translocase FtsK 4TM domain-containing protein [Myxococcaceae bacterium]
MAAARKARAEKAVLSRQDIASRRRALETKKGKPEGHSWRPFAALGLLALSVLGLVALFSEGTESHPANAAGPVGHALAALLSGWLGVCAASVPLAGLYAAGALGVGTRSRRRWPQLASVVALLLCVAVLAELTAGGPHQPHPPGGALGALLAETLTGWFSVVGTLIVVAAVGASALLVVTRFALLRWLAAAGRGLAGLAGRAQALLSALWAAKQRALEARSRARAEAKLEEAAFLAQLEADDEELADAEREAGEAEAVAEEAMRLHRAAEAAQLRSPPAALPAMDPAWANSLATGVRLPTEEASGRRRRRADLASPTEPPAGPVAAASEEEAAAPARTPLIIEPKAPPKPSARKEQEQFEFVGGRTRFTLPPLDVLSCDRKERTALDKEVFLSTAAKLRAKLADFGIDGEVVEIRPGPVVTMYEFLPGPGIKVSKIASLADDLAMAMEAMRVRIVAPIPGKGVVGIEVPNRDRETVYLREIVEQDVFQRSASKLTMALGKDIEGMPYVFDLAKAPHLLIAGTTGSGKSVAVNAMIMSILLKATPEEVRFLMVDPKMLELSVYEGIPHLLLPVVTDPKKAALALRWAVEEMERRYALLAEAGVRNIAGFNKLVEGAGGDARALLAAKENESAAKKAARPASTLIVDVADGESEEEALSRARAESVGVPLPREGPEELRTSLSAPGLEPVGVEAPAEGAAEPRELRKLPYLVVIIDELADLMMVASREVETSIARLAQMARAAGIHLMVATQRPSTDVVTGVIKANFPTRITFMLRTKPDSMTILGTTGAEALLGMGDMLLMPPTSAHLTRVHGAFVSEPEIKAAVDHLKAQGKPVYDESILRAREEDASENGLEDELSDELYDQALATVSDMRQVSISMLQRKMRIGYNRAARMIERMERDGVVGPADGAKPREVFLRPLGELPGAGAP